MAHIPRKNEAPKTRAEQAHDAVYEVAVKLVAEGFNAIDELAEIGKRELKRAIVRGIAAHTKRKP